MATFKLEIFPPPILPEVSTRKKIVRDFLGNFVIGAFNFPIRITMISLFDYLCLNPHFEFDGHAILNREPFSRINIMYISDRVNCLPNKR